MKNRFLSISLIVILVVGLALSTALVTGCAESTTPSSKATGSVTELVITDVVTGEGTEAIAGSTLSMHYTGWLYDESSAGNKGKKFDSSLDRGRPFEFKLGMGRVIKDWDQGVAGMKVGGQRTLTIPSNLGYGARGAGGSIPPNAALIFDVELLDVR